MALDAFWKRVLYMHIWIVIILVSHVICSVVSCSPPPNFGVGVPACTSLPSIRGAPTATHLKVYIYILHMWKALCQNTIFELGIDIASLCSGMALNALWKRALRIFFCFPDSRLIGLQFKQLQYGNLRVWGRKGKGVICIFICWSPNNSSPV